MHVRASWAIPAGTRAPALARHMASDQQERKKIGRDPRVGGFSWVLMWLSFCPGLS